MKAEDHKKQIRRIFVDAKDIRKNAQALSELNVAGPVMVLIELCTLGFGFFHLIYGDFFLSAIVLSFDIALLILHLTGMSFERRLHHGNTARLDRLIDECEEKANDLLDTAEAFNIKVRGWYRAMRKHLRSNTLASPPAAPT